MASNNAYRLTDGTARTFQIRENGKIVSASTGGNSLVLKNEVEKGGVKVGTDKTILRTEVDDRLADIELFYDRKKDRFAIEMEKFIAAVQGKGEVAATGEEGVVTMKLLDAIYKSSELDREVEI